MNYLLSRSSINRIILPILSIACIIGFSTNSNAQPADLPWETDSSCESIITTGIMAVSCGVTLDVPSAEQYSFGMMDINGVLPAAGRVDVSTDVEMYHHPSWHIDSIGNVFGITMDACGNTFTTASSNYGAGYFFAASGIIQYGIIGGGPESLEAAGTIYKIDGQTGQASVFAQLPQQAFSFQHANCEGPDITDRNTGPALGNITFSYTNRIFYVSNFEDGRIYRLDESGTILDSYDPLIYDDGQPGTPELNQLAYGLDINPDGTELFFGTSGGTGITTNPAQIFSLPLNADGSFAGTIDNTNLPAGATWDNYVGSEEFHYEVIGSSFISDVVSISDMEFTPSGDLLVGARVGCQGSIHNSYNHGGTALLLSDNGTGLYNNLEGIIYTGFEFSIGGSNESYGGVSVFESPDGTTQFAISSADQLAEEGPHGICIVEEGVFGVSGSPASPAGAISYGLVDLLSNDPKGVGGDVKVFVQCDCDTTCSEEATAAFVAEIECGNLTVNFTNQSTDATDYEWHFNDPANPGATSSAVNPSYTYSSFGTYEITLIVEPGTECADTLSSSISLIPSSLEPDFSIQVLQCLDSLLIQVTDLSTDTLSTIVMWNWELATSASIYPSNVQNPTFSVGETGPATLSLIITNAEGCIEVLTEQFLIKDSPLSLDLGPDLQFCGPQTVELAAGTGFASYLWSTSEVTSSITVTSAGTYSVTASDACGEEYSDAVSISIDTAEINLPPAVEVCSGGSFTFDVPGFASYEWAPADFLSCTDCPGPTTTPDNDITYTLTATSADGCVAMGSTSVSVQTAFQSALSLEACEGGTVIYDGTELEPGSSTDFTFVAANGCDSTVTVTVDGLPNFASDLGLSACEGGTVAYNGTELEPGSSTEFTFVAANGCDSTVTVSVSALPGVSTAASIAICPGGTADIFGEQVGAAGEYSMTFVAANGCDSTHTITLSVFDAVDLSATAVDATCFGSADGSASAGASGGEPPYSYAWDNGDNGPDISGLAAGPYSVTATDANGCSASIVLGIGQPTAVVAVATGVDVSCDGPGSASASASGGTPDYTYEWSTGETTAGISGLLAGTYSVTATDLNGCSAVASVDITGALGPDVAVTVDQLPTEDEPEAGALSATISGGTAPFSVEWSNGADGLSIDGLGSGGYTVTVTDDNGCTATSLAYIYIPGCTGGKIWDDLDRDGCQTGGELGLGGIAMELMGTDIWGNDVSMTTVTAINGEYIFEPLPPGDYQVYLPVPDGYAQSPMDNCTDDFVDSDFDGDNLSFVVGLEEGHCCLIVDGGLYDDCLQVIDPGSICCGQVLCGPGVDPGPITSSSPATGAGGPIEYMWMYSTSGGPFGSGSWTGIPGTNTTSYDPGPLAETTWFARCVRAAGCTGWLEGNMVQIIVDDEASAVVDGPTSTCVGDTEAYSAHDNGPGATYGWDFGPWATPQYASTREVDVIWGQAGVVYATLSVTVDGCTSTATHGIAISDSPVYCSSNFGTGNGPGHAVQKGATAAFSVFPNPAQDLLNVSWDREVEGQLALELTAVDGRQVMTTSAFGGEMRHSIDLSETAPGVYLLKVRYSDGLQKVLRVVVQ